MPFILILLTIAFIFLPTLRCQQATSCSEVYPSNATHVILALLDITAWDFTTSSRIIQLDQVYQSEHMVALMNLVRSNVDSSDSNIYGTIVCDTFSLVDTAVHTAVEVLRNASKTVIGILGPSTASSALAVAKSVSGRRLPVISHAPFIPPATAAPCPNLFRTAPSTDALLSKLFDAILQLQWTYFSVIVSDASPYPEIVQQLQRKIAPLAYRICISSVIEVSPYSTQEQLNATWTNRLSKKHSEKGFGVVFIGDRSLFNRLLATEATMNQPNSPPVVQWLYAGRITPSDRIPPNTRVFSLEFNGNIVVPPPSDVSITQLTSLFSWFRTISDYDTLKSSYYYRHLTVGVVDLVTAHRACTKQAQGTCSTLDALYKQNPQLSSFSLPSAYQSFNENNTLPSVDVMKLRLPEPSSSPPDWSSSCPHTCPECVDMMTNSVIHIPGDYYILGIFPVHDRDPNDLVKCGEFRKTGGYILVEALFYAMQIVNKELDKSTLTVRDAIRQFENFDFKVGAILIDDCNQPQRLASLLSTVLGDDDARMRYGWPRREKILGIVGSFSSDLSMTAAAIAKVFHLPIISYGSTAISLSDKSKYPYFLRTVPSDAFQVDAMLQLLQKLEWNYVSVVNSQNEYGRGGFRELMSNAASKGICVGLQQEIDESTDVPKLINNIQNYSNARGVIFFGEDTFFANITKELTESGQFYFITSEAVGNRPEVIDSTNGRKLLGSIILHIQNGEEGILPDNLDVFIGRKDAKTMICPWFLELWEATFSCSLPGRFVRNHFDSCAGRSLTLDGKEWEDPYRVSVMNAVMSLVRGAVDMAFDVCKPTAPILSTLCESFQTEDRAKQLTSKIRNVTLSPSATGSKMRPFTVDGEGNTGYDLFSVQFYRKPTSVFTGAYKIDTKSLNLQQSYKFYTESLLVTPASGIRSVCEHGSCLAKCPLSVKTVNNDWMITTIALLVISPVLLLVLATVIIVFAVRRRRPASMHKADVLNFSYRPSTNPDVPLRNGRPGSVSHFYEEANDPARISYISIRQQMEMSAAARLSLASATQRDGIHYHEPRHPPSAYSSGSTAQFVRSGSEESIEI